VDLTTYPAVPRRADVRLRSSVGAFINADREPCGTGYAVLPVSPTILEEPPLQTHGGGFNASLSVPDVTPEDPLPDSASIDVRFFLGIMQTGGLRIAVLVEAFPEGGALWWAEGTDARIWTDSGGPTTGIEPGPAEALTLTAPVPNPTRGRATFFLAAPAAGHATATLYDARGRRVAILLDGPIAARSPLALDVDARDLPAGLYFVRVSAAGYDVTRPLTVTR
jgi:hypothetical protein